MNNHQFLARFVNTVSSDDPRYPSALKLFRDVCVEARIRQRADIDSPVNEYMPQAPKFKVRKLTLTEAVKTAMRFDVSRFVMSFAP